MMKSSSPKTSAPPPIPPKISPEAHRRLAAAAAEKPAKEQEPPTQPAKLLLSPLKPTREPPAPPQTYVSPSKINDKVPLSSTRAAPSPLQTSALGIDAPPQILSSPSPKKLSKTVTTSLSPEKRPIITRQRAATILRKARESIGLGGIISPETDSEHEDLDDKYVMSGGLAGDDLSERELSGRDPRTVRVSRFHEDFEDDPIVEDPAVGEKDMEEASKNKKERRSSMRSPVKRGTEETLSPKASERGAQEKETVRLTRTYKRRTTRTTIGDDGYVVDSESETEYYETVGPVGGCVVS